jgi:hypothetical protein
MNKACLLMTAATAFLAGSATAESNAEFLLPSGVRVTVVEATFNKSLFKISGCNNGNGNGICIINGRAPLGTDSALPKTFLKNITVSHQKHFYSLNVSNMYNAWGSRPLEVKGVIRYFGGKCQDAKNCQFRGIFSDGAGTFVAEWKVVGGAPIRTILTNSNDIINFFMGHIDPPEFD